ncbi:MAG TPA: TonB family protein [Thermoanaerobaculia bacterium]|jgi:protein TonB|nr:TonB family protein [Thermoanaerobaculia bacterium]
MFEHSLIDLETKQQPRRRWISLPIAVALHVGGLSAFAFASYWTVGSVPEPRTNIGPVTILTLPELPAGGGGGGRPQPVRPERPQPEPVRPTQPVQPTAETVPDEVPAPATTTQVDDLVPATDAGGDLPGGGDPNLPIGPGIGPGPGGPGVGPGGDGDGPGVVGVADDQPIRFTVGMTRPVPVHQVQPRYTENARRAGVQGMVTVEAIIDEQGNVDNVRVLRGLPMGLDREAAAAIQQWKFKPAMMGSRPVKVYFTLTVNFTIQR